jgi:hypothetical protein
MLDMLWTIKMKFDWVIIKGISFISDIRIWFFALDYHEE